MKIITFVLTSAFFLSLSLFAAPNEHLKKIELLSKEKKYATAANYILNNNLLDEAEFIPIYTDLLTNNYLTTIHYKFFALKDLEPNETVEELRGKAGKFEIIGDDLEKILYNKHKDLPDNPHINFAIGTYFSRGFACNCLTPEYFPKQANIEIEYFKKAYQKGVFDYWSLFKIGFYNHQNGDIDKAQTFYEKSIELNPQFASSNYNLSIIYLNKNNLEKALLYSTNSLGKYNDAKLDADTYNINGLIQQQLGKYTEAEKMHLKSLKLLKSHDTAFRDLLSVYKETNQPDKYVNAVYSFLANDFSNPYYFNKYIEHIANSGLIEFDQKVYEKLIDLKLKNDNEIGPLYYNLGRFADLRKDTQKALEFYSISLASFKKLDSPSEGAIEALNSLIGELKAIKN
jgi:tetratricopeptide (TPR) repeat protein